MSEHGGAEVHDIVGAVQDHGKDVADDVVDVEGVEVALVDPVKADESHIDSLTLQSCVNSGKFFRENHICPTTHVADHHFIRKH